MGATAGGITSHRFGPPPVCKGSKLRHRFPVSIVWGATPTRWPHRGVRVRQRINRNPSGSDCEALRRACCYSAALPFPVLPLGVEFIPFVGRSPYPSLRFLSYRGPCGLSSSVDMDGVPTLHLPFLPSGTRGRTLHRQGRIRCADVVGCTVTDVLDRVRCIRVYRHRVM